MANSAEAVGQLLAQSMLMKGERQLLGKKDEAPAQAATPTAQQTAEPIAHDSKAVAAVLLTLLDERLQASDAELAARLNSPDGKNLADGSDADASRRVAAKYMQDGLSAGDDSLRPDMTIPPIQVQVLERPPIVSPDLQTFMQRFVAFAAGRSITTDPESMGDGRASRRNVSSLLDGPPTFRVVALALGLLWLVVLIIEWAAK
jgi:hypothetical protein